jgi:hypothetical protein
MLVDDVKVVKEVKWVVVVAYVGKEHDEVQMMQAPKPRVVM